MKFAPSPNPQIQLNTSFFSPKAEEELRGIDSIVGLKESTCTHRAAMAYLEKSKGIKPDLKFYGFSDFEDGFEHIRQNVNAALLVPELHPIQRRLSQKSHFPELTTQRFSLPNPKLFLACLKSPERSGSVRTYLFALDALVPLLQRTLGNRFRFEEVVKVQSTQSAAEYCRKIFGGGFCITNERGISTFGLRPLIQLPEICMRWFFYKKRAANLNTAS